MAPNPAKTLAHPQRTIDIPGPPYPFPGSPDRPAPGSALARMLLIAELADNPPLDEVSIPAMIAVLGRIRRLRVRLDDLDAGVPRRGN